MRQSRGRKTRNEKHAYRPFTPSLLERVSLHAILIARRSVVYMENVCSNPVDQLEGAKII
jgi:hypothetical protein